MRKKTKPMSHAITEPAEGPVRMRMFDLSLWRAAQQEAKKRGDTWRKFVEQALREYMGKKQ
jgi:hypothetical protein